MKCSECQTDNLGHSLFCEECGATLEASCPQCGSGNRPADRHRERAKSVRVLDWSARYFAGYGDNCGSNSTDHGDQNRYRRLVRRSLLRAERRRTGSLHSLSGLDTGEDFTDTILLLVEMATTILLIDPPKRPASADDRAPKQVESAAPPALETIGHFPGQVGR